MQNPVPELIPCIVCGGAGSRLWPVSRQAFPKPFIRLADDQSLLQKTFLRAASLPGVRRVLIVANEETRFRTLDECQAVNAGGLALELLLEPERRNTAPALAAAAAPAGARSGGRSAAAGAAGDHLIRDEAAFAAAVERAARLAGAGRVVAFGLKPSRPETGFGYIETGVAIGADGLEVARFVEKPDLAAAERYLADGRHLWNSGMFCFAAASLRAALAEHAPQVLAGVEASLAASQAVEDGGVRQRELHRAGFARCPDISIDYAVMERIATAAVVPCELGWSDIGAWDSLAAQFPADADGNRVSGEALLQGSRDCFIQSRGRLIAALGVDNLVVVDTPDALLVAPLALSGGARAQRPAAAARPPQLARTSEFAAALGSLHRAGRQRALQDQAHRGEAGRVPVPADASPPQRALDRGQRHRAGDAWRHGTAGVHQ